MPTSGGVRCEYVKRVGQRNEAYEAFQEPAIR
jgi:hypothetical protein